ncbi:hypothetical protein [Polaromonas sp.]|uniref:hypothetical protein n=1 Tax=Polaromonas sp. TaxID=1869339 RepID=UPI00326427A6
MRTNALTSIGLAQLALCAVLVTPQSAKAQPLCPPTWPAAFTVKAKAILELLANTAYKRNQPVALANCVRDAAMQTNIDDALTADPEHLSKVLKQVADFQRTTSATLKASGDSGAAAYWLKQEAEFRAWYLSELASPVKPPPTAGPLRITYLEGVHFLMDGYEIVNTAEPVVLWMYRAPVETYYPATYDIWVRAVASCSSWNFKDAANATDAALKTSLCSSACKPMAISAREAIDDFAGRAPPGALAKSRGLLDRTRQALKSCGGGK